MATIEDVLAKMDRIIGLLEALVIQNERPADKSLPTAPSREPQYVQPPQFFTPIHVPQTDGWVPPPPVTCEKRT